MLMIKASSDEVRNQVALLSSGIEKHAQGSRFIQDWQLLKVSH